MATPVERKAARTVGVGVIVLIIILVTLFLTFKAQTGVPFRPTTQVTAAFKDIHSLRTNDDVRANSKRIGRILSLDYGADGTALVTMEIDGSYDVFNNAHAEVWDYSALATKFVELDRGTPDSGPLAGGTIPVAQTDSSKDLNQVLDILDTPTRAAATSSVRELGGGLAGRAPDIQDLLKSAPSLLTNLGTVTGALAAPEANLPGLLNSASDLTASLETRDRQIRALLGQANQTFRAVTVDRAVPLQQTLAEAPRTLDTVRPALDRLDAPLADTQATMQTLQPGAAALAAATPDLRGVFREGVPTLGRLTDVSQRAEPAVEQLTPTVADLRPLAPPVVTGLAGVNTALQGLAPYGPEIGLWIPRVQSFVSQGPDENHRYARVGPDVSASTLTSGLIPGCDPRGTSPDEPGGTGPVPTPAGCPVPGVPVGAAALAPTTPLTQTPLTGGN